MSFKCEARTCLSKVFIFSLSPMNQTVTVKFNYKSENVFIDEAPADFLLLFKVFLANSNLCFCVLRWWLCHFVEEHRGSACGAGENVLCWDCFSPWIPAQLRHRPQRPQTWQVSVLKLLESIFLILTLVQMTMCNVQGVALTTNHRPSQL